jgi:hypothetical protein
MSPARASRHRAKRVGRSRRAAVADMKFHPLTELFPLMQGREFRELVTDIKAHGLRVPITTYQGKILDGRNRARACERAGIHNPPTGEYVGDNPFKEVLSLNLHRRHLSESQIAGILTRNVLPLLTAQAKARQAHGKTAPGQTLKETIPEALKGQARDTAATFSALIPVTSPTRNAYSV